MKAGAWSRGGFHKRVTHVITDKKQIEGGGFSHIQKESAKYGIPILSEQFVLSSKAKSTLLDTSSFLLVSSLVCIDVATAIIDCLSELKLETEQKGRR